MQNNQKVQEGEKARLKKDMYVNNSILGLSLVKKSDILTLLFKGRDGYYFSVNRPINSSYVIAQANQFLPV